MELFIGGRRSGKTTACLRWVEQATQTASYPFWDRVLLAVNKGEADRLRRLLRERAVDRGWTQPRLGLTYNMVYTVEEWGAAHLGIKPVQVMLDNADLFLSDLFNRGGNRLIGFTASGTATPADWEVEDEIG
jgi:hypothetical protein